MWIGFHANLVNCAVQRMWIKNASDYLNAKYRKCLQADGLPDPLEPLQFKPELDTDEAEYFMLGLESRIFEIDDEGYAQSPLLPSVNAVGKQKILQMFWHGPNRRFLFREGVCQLASASSLILKYGWQLSQVYMEPSGKDFGAVAYGVDFLVQSLAGQALICGEAKKNIPELEKLRQGFHDCCQRGSHSKKICRFPQNHAKFAFCSLAKPQYFWMVAPGREYVYQLSYVDTRIVWEQIDLLPHRPMLENE